MRSCGDPNGLPGMQLEFPLLAFSEAETLEKL